MSKQTSQEQEFSEVWKILMDYGYAFHRAQPSAVDAIRETRKAEAKINKLLMEAHLQTKGRDE